MKNKVLALCDSDEIYCNRFLNYYMNHKVLGIELITYTSVEILLNDPQRNNISIYLLTDSFWISELCEKQENRKDICVIYFSKNRKCETLTRDDENQICEHSIYKYQSMDAIFREFFTIESEFQNQEKADYNYLSKEVNSNCSKVISLFSPSNEDIQSYIAMNMAKQLGEDKKVLYINLTENFGMDQLFEETYKEDISDLFYYIKEKKGDLEKRLRALIYYTNYFDYIPSAFQAKGLYELSKEEWMIFFTLLQRLEYNVILIDFGNSILGLEELFQNSDYLYCITKEIWMSEIRMKHFMKTIAFIESDQTKMQICKIPLKMNTLYLKQNTFLELESNELTEYVKKMLQNVVL